MPGQWANEVRERHGTVRARVKGYHKEDCDTREWRTSSLLLECANDEASSEEHCKDCKEAASGHQPQHRLQHVVLGNEHQRACTEALTALPAQLRAGLRGGLIARWTPGNRVSDRVATLARLVKACTFTLTARSLTQETTGGQGFALGCAGKRIPPL